MQTIILIIFFFLFLSFKLFFFNSNSNNNNLSNKKGKLLFSELKYLYHILFNKITFGKKNFFEYLLNLKNKRILLKNKILKRFKKSKNFKTNFNLLWLRNWLEQKQKYKFFFKAYGSLLYYINIVKDRIFEEELLETNSEAIRIIKNRDILYSISFEVFLDVFLIFFFYLIFVLLIIHSDYNRFDVKKTPYNNLLFLLYLLVYYNFILNPFLKKETYVFFFKVLYCFKDFFFLLSFQSEILLILVILILILSIINFQVIVFEYLFFKSFHSDKIRLTSEDNIIYTKILIVLFTVIVICLIILYFYVHAFISYDANVQLWQLHINLRVYTIFTKGYRWIL